MQGRGESPKIEAIGSRLRTKVGKLDIRKKRKNLKCLSDLKRLVLTRRNEQQKPSKALDLMLSPRSVAIRCLLLKT